MAVVLLPYTCNERRLDSGLPGRSRQAAHEKVKGAGERVHPAALTGPVLQGGVQPRHKLFFGQLHHGLGLHKP